MIVVIIASLARMLKRLSLTLNVSVMYLKPFKLAMKPMLDMATKAKFTHELELENILPFSPFLYYCASLYLLSNLTSLATVASQHALFWVVAFHDNQAEQRMYLTLFHDL